MAISIKIGANASEAIREARRAGDAIEGIGDSLDGLTRDSQRSSREAAQALDAIPDGVRDAARDVDRQSRKLGDGLGDGVDRGVKDAEGSLDRLERSFKDTVRDVQRTDGKGGLGSSIGESTKKGVGEAKEGLHEFRDESNSTAKEAAASFDGSAASIGDAFQEVAANAFAGFGPAGAVAGLAAAAGLGLAIAKITEIQERQQALKAKTSELAQAMIEGGREGAVGYDVVADKLKELATEQDDLGVDLRSLKGIADEAQQPFDDLAQAYAGNVGEIDKLVQKHRDIQAELIKTNHASGDAATSYEGDNSKRINSEQKYLDKLNEVQKTAKDAALEQKLYLQSGAADLAANAEALASWSGSVQDGYEQAGEAAQGFTEDGSFSLDQYVAKATAAADAVEKYSANMGTAVAKLGKDGHDNAIRYLEQLGPDAAPLVAAFIQAPAKRQGELAALWDRLGNTSSDSFGSGLQSGLNAQGPASKSVRVTADLSGFNADMAYATRLREAHIRVYTDNMGGRRQGMGVP